MDVDTGFWLWAAAVPLLLIGYVVDLVASHRGAALMYAVSGLFAVVLCAIVVTFLLLMRAGYRWARTTLTGGGLATIVSVTIRVFTGQWQPLPAVVCAVTGIVGSVLIAGGVVLLHRKDAHGYFTR
ncbi:hypothetical protein [Mycobacterium botniense]|uniref:Uncharacterized protein n=1 Tax=Mycobacterium botniense TaxID=84962 RepID=A0A7I9XTN5_9MYCO|nr:hypothetical protein [Mycobacterium botniense]GFG73371.1 hypothetical protein MBOT_07360 [Mycobacterium botniense]